MSLNDEDDEVLIGHTTGGPNMNRSEFNDMDQTHHNVSIISLK